MSADLAQLVSLVSHANVYLQGGDVNFDLEKSLSAYCYSFEFLEQPIEGIAGSSKTIASDPSGWLAYLKTIDAKRVKLHYQQLTGEIPEHISAAFVDGGRQWLLEVQFSVASDLYSCSPQFYEIASNPSKRPVVLLDRNLDSLDDISPSVEDARSKLDEVLESLHNLAAKFEYTQNWAGIFNRARKSLTVFVPQESDYLIPFGFYSLEARQLIEAAFASWVFGGMGSWNDLTFSGDDDVQYNALSENLYAVICDALASGVNSYP